MEKNSLEKMNSLENIIITSIFEKHYCSIFKEFKSSKEIHWDRRNGNKLNCHITDNMMEVDWKNVLTFYDCTVDIFLVTYLIIYDIWDQIRKFNSAIIIMEEDENKDTHDVIAQNGELIWKINFWKSRTWDWK